MTETQCSHTAPITVAKLITILAQIDSSAFVMTFDQATNKTMPVQQVLAGTIRTGPLDGQQYVLIGFGERS